MKRQNEAWGNGGPSTCYNQKKTNSIFQKKWWLDAVAPQLLRVAEVKKNDSVSAYLPYVISKKAGLTVIGMPKLTQTLGPWLAPSSAKYANQLSQQKKIMTALIAELPPFDYFCQNFHYTITNWLPFHWHGFTQTTRYTYILDQLSDTDKVWSGFKENIRTDVRKASKRLVVKRDLPIEKFIDLNTLTFKRQGRALPYSRGLVKRLDRACAEYKSRKIFFAEDSQGRIHAAVYIVWDEKSAYYLMGGADPELRNSGATSLLLWEAIQFAATVTQRFDFEGSMIESVERFFRAFGARQVPYFQITSMNRRMKVLMGVKDILQTMLSGNKR